MINYKCLYGVTFRMHTYLTCIILVLVSVMFQSCAYNIEDELYPPETCDTTDVSYSQQILPIIDVKCIECHSENPLPLAIPLVGTGGYDNIKSYIEGGRLIGAIKRLPNYWPMPGSGRPALKACEISIIEHWVLQGYPDN